MNIEDARINMVKQQVKTWDVIDERVLDAMSNTAKELFVPSAYQHVAYADTDIPLSPTQKMLAPCLIGRLLQAAQLQPNETVFEIGTGTGYLTALLSQLVKHVTSIELDANLLTQARQNLTRASIHNVELLQGDGLQELPDLPQFDAILLTGSVQQIPQHLIHMLRPKGRLIAVIGQSPSMRLTCFTRTHELEIQQNALLETDAPALVQTQRNPFNF